MGTIFKHNNQLIQCRDLNKKLKKLRISATDIEIVKDDIPNDILEKTFVDLTREIKKEVEDDDRWHYFIFKNSKGYYLWGINKPDLSYIAKFGFDVSDYKLIDECIGSIADKYMQWNPETKTGWKI